MAVLLFHGGEILGFFAGMVVGFAGWATILSLLFTRPPRNPIIPAILYLLIASIPGMLFLLSDDLNMLQLIFVWIFSFPWSMLFVVLATFFNLDFGSSAALVGAFLNAITFYVVGKTARFRLDREFK